MDLLNTLNTSLIAILVGVLVFIAQFIYIRDTFRRKIQPSILSWSGWVLLMGTSLVSLIISEGWKWSLTGLLISTIGCSIIAGLGFFIKNYSLQKSDWIYLIAGIVCMLLYFVTKDTWLTTIFAITADFLLAIPTFLKAIKNPISEKSHSWIFGFIAWTLSLLISFGDGIIFALWPLYLFCFYSTMLYLTFFRNRHQVKITMDK